MSTQQQDINLQFHVEVINWKAQEASLLTELAELIAHSKWAKVSGEYHCLSPKGVWVEYFIYLAWDKEAQTYQPWLQACVDNKFDWEAPIPKGGLRALYLSSLETIKRHVEATRIEIDF